MHIGIIGAGFTGLSAAHNLQQMGHRVTIFEQEAIPGGLAMGFKKPRWDWSLEKHYHHIFTSDTAIRTLSEEIEVPFIFTRPNTSSLLEGDILQLDSPLKLLQFSKLSLGERVRMGAVLGYLRYIADWHILERLTAHEWLQKTMGKRPYQMLWEPLLKAKFGSYYKQISLAWFWARIKARSTELGYPEGGFQHFAETLSKRIQKNKGTIHYQSRVKKITSSTRVQLAVEHEKGKQEMYTMDRVLVTLPNIIFNSLAAGLPSDYKETLKKFEGIGAVNMVLELSEPLLPHDVYWLNICDAGYPFLAVVEHTNFIEKSHYNNHHIVYIGNYLPHGHKYFSLKEQELLKEYDTRLQSLKKNYQDSIVSISTFKVPFAQPIVPKNFSTKILPFKTPLRGVFLANMQQVYPWDRGTNFAVQLGQQVATEIDRGV